MTPNSRAGPQVTERAAPRVLRRVPFSGEGSAAPEVLAEREWLITNGLGGYASGTLLGAITRRYHGLLIAALPAPLGRVMMLNQLTEYLELPDGRQIELSSGLGFNESSESPGFASLAEFRLEDGVPVWRYQIGGIVIEKKIFMVHGRNTTVISYDLLEGDERVRVKLCPHVQFRPHENFVDKALEDYTLRTARRGFEICTAAAYPPLRLLVHGREWGFSGGDSKIDKVFFRAEQQRGYEAFGELCSFGWFEAEVCRDEPMTVIASTEPWESITEMTPQESYAEELSRRQRLASRAGIEEGTSIKAELVLAADQFVIAPSIQQRKRRRRRAHDYRRLSLVYRLGPRHDDQLGRVDAADRPPTRGARHSRRIFRTYSRRADSELFSRRRAGRAFIIPRTRRCGFFTRCSVTSK